MHNWPTEGLPVLPDLDHKGHLAFERLAAQFTRVSDEAPMHVGHVFHDVGQSPFERVPITPDVWQRGGLNGIDQYGSVMWVDLARDPPNYAGYPR